MELKQKIEQRRQERERQSVIEERRKTEAALDRLTSRDSSDPRVVSQIDPSHISREQAEKILEKAAREDLPPFASIVALVAFGCGVYLWANLNWQTGLFFIVVGLGAAYTADRFFVSAKKKEIIRNRQATNLSLANLSNRKKS